eukprot:m.603682 g.603682  ORF g.603682 m.603682 type:complete len:54 (-) comp58103_c1_seq9:401-562(-)
MESGVDVVGDVDVVGADDDDACLSDVSSFIPAQFLTRTDDPGTRIRWLAVRVD